MDTVRIVKKKTQVQQQEIDTSTVEDEISYALSVDISDTTSGDETGDGQIGGEPEGDGPIATIKGSSQEGKSIASGIKEKRERIKQTLETTRQIMADNKHILLGTDKKLKSITKLIADIQETETVKSEILSSSHVLSDVKGKKVYVIHVTDPEEKRKDATTSISERTQAVSSSPSLQFMVPSDEGCAAVYSLADAETSRTGYVHSPQLKGTVTYDDKDASQSRTTMKDASEDACGDKGSDHSVKESDEEYYGGGDKEKEHERQKYIKKNQKEEKTDEDKGSRMEIILCLCFSENYFRRVPYSKQRSLHHILSQPTPTAEMRLKDSNTLVLHFSDIPSVSTVYPLEKESLTYIIKVSQNEWKKVPESEKQNILKILYESNVYAHIAVTSNNTLELNVHPIFTSTRGYPKDTSGHLKVTQKDVASEKTTTTSTTIHATNDRSEEKSKKKERKTKHLEIDAFVSHDNTSRYVNVSETGDGRKDDSDGEQKRTMTSPAVERARIVKNKLSLELLRKMDAGKCRLILQQLTDQKLRELLLLESHEQIEVHCDIHSNFQQTYVPNKILVNNLLDWSDGELKDILKNSGRGILMFLKETDISSAKIVNFLEKLDVQFIMRQPSLNTKTKTKYLTQMCLEVPNKAQLDMLDKITDEGAEELLTREKAEKNGCGTSQLSLNTLRSMTIKQCKRALKHMSDEEIVKLLTSAETEPIIFPYDVSKKLTKEEKSNMGTLSKTLTKLKNEELKELLKKSGHGIVRQLKKNPHVMQSLTLLKKKEVLYGTKTLNDQHMNKILKTAQKQNKLAAKEAINLAVKFRFIESAMELAHRYALIEEAIQLGETYGFVKEAIDIAAEGGNLDEAIRLARKYGYSVVLEELEQLDRVKKEAEKLEKSVSVSEEAKLMELQKKGYINIPLYLSLDVFKAFDIHTMETILNNLTDEELVEMLMLEKGRYIKTYLKKEKKRCITPLCTYRKKKNIIRTALLKMNSCRMRYILKNHTGDEILEELKKKSKRVKLKILDIQKEILLQKTCEANLHIKLLDKELQKVASDILKEETLDNEKKIYIKQLISSIQKKKEEEEEEELQEIKTQKPSTSEETEKTSYDVKLYLTYESLKIYHPDTIKNVFKQLTDRKILKIFKMEEDEYMEVQVVTENKRKHKKKIKRGLLGKTLRKMRKRKLRKLLNLKGEEALEKLKKKHENVVIALLEIDVEDLQEDLQNKQSYKNKLEEEIKKLKIEKKIIEKNKIEEQFQMHHGSTPLMKQTSDLKETAIPSTSTSVNMWRDNRTVTLYVPYGLLQHISTKTVKKILSRMTDEQAIKLFLSKYNECVEVHFQIKREKKQKKQIKKEIICKYLLKMPEYKLKKLLKLPGEDALEALMKKYSSARIRYLQIEYERLEKQLAIEKEKNKRKIKEIKKFERELNIIYLQQHRKQREKQKKDDKTFMIHPKQKSTVLSKFPSSEIQADFTLFKKPSIIIVDMEDSYAHSMHDNNLELQMNLNAPLKDPHSVEEAALLHKDEQPGPAPIDIHPNMSSSIFSKVTFTDDSDGNASSRTLSEITSYQETGDEMEENIIYGKQGIVQEHFVFQKVLSKLRNEKRTELSYYDMNLGEVENETLRNSTLFEPYTVSIISTFIFTFFIIYYIYKKRRIL